MHGRTIPLNGSSFENIFVHYMPAAATRGHWYNSDFFLSFGEPMKEYTLENLMENDEEARTALNSPLRSS